MMKMTFTISLISIFLLIGSIESFGQFQFQITIGSTQYEYANTIIQTTDGGYILSGSIQQVTGYYNMYIVKLDASGTLQWTETIGESNEEHGNAIIRTTDGSYVVAGGTASFGAGSFDMYMVKLDASGSPQWAKTFGGTSHDEAFSIVQTSDGGYAIAGQTSSFGAEGGDLYIVKLNSSGLLQWSRTVGGSRLDETSSIIQTTDGGYVIAGETNSFGVIGSDVYIVKLDTSGILQWSKTIGTTTGSEGANSIIQTLDGGYVAAGITNSFGAVGAEMYIVKLNAAGGLQWTKTIGGNGNDYGYSIKQTTDGGYITAGFTYSFGAYGSDMYIVKLDTAGTHQWSRTIGVSSYDQALSIIQTSDGGYAAAGLSFVTPSGEMYIVKLNSAGNTCGNTINTASQSGTGGTINSPTSIVTNPTSSVTTPTPSTSTSGTVTTICITAIQPVSNQIPSSFELYQNYPNPFNPTTKIKFSLPNPSEGGANNVKLIVYDIMGREVASLIPAGQEGLQPGTYEVDFDGSSYSSGIYYYRLETQIYFETKKMLLIK